MMKFFLSAELDIEIDRSWMRVSNKVEKKLNKFLKKQNYGNAIQNIGVIPIIVRPQWQDDFHERRLFLRKQASADYRLSIDFDKVKSGSDEIREKLLLKNIFEVVTDLTRKTKNEFDGERLMSDVLNLFGVTRSDIESV